MWVNLNPTSMYNDEVYREGKKENDTSEYCIVEAFCLYIYVIMYREPYAKRINWASCLAI